MKNQKNLAARQSREGWPLFSVQKHLGQEKTSREASERGHLDSLWEKSVHLAEAATREMASPSAAEMTLPEQFFRAANQKYRIPQLVRSLRKGYPFGY
jgi:hypothetical protein